MKVYKNELISFKNKLNSQKITLEGNLTLLIRQFESLEWQDNICEITKETLNLHIDTISRLIESINSDIAHISKLIDKLDEYFVLGK